MIVPVLFLDFELRKDFIVKNYCINKNRPEMHCDGKCYLAKRIRSAQEQDEKQATDQFVHHLFNLENLGQLHQISVEFSIISVFIEQVNNFHYPSPSLQHAASFVFHPPQA